MDEKPTLSDFEKEYLTEASDERVSVNDLKEYGVSDRTLSAEIYMVENFGNEIVKHEFKDEYDETMESSVTQLDDEDISMSEIYSNVLDSIDKNDFDEKIDIAIGGIDL